MLHLAKHLQPNPPCFVGVGQVYRPTGYLNPRHVTGAQGPRWINQVAVAARRLVATLLAAASGPTNAPNSAPANRVGNSTGYLMDDDAEFEVGSASYWDRWGPYQFSSEAGYTNCMCCWD